MDTEAARALCRKLKDEGACADLKGHCEICAVNTQFLTPAEEEWQPASALPVESPGLVWWWEPGLERPFFVAITSAGEKKKPNCFRSSTTGWWKPVEFPAPPRVKP